MLQLDEELKREAEAERQKRAQAVRHPDPRDPEWRGTDNQEN